MANKQDLLLYSIAATDNEGGNPLRRPRASMRSLLLTSYPEKYRGPLYLFIYVYMNVVLINHDYVYKDWHQKSFSRITTTLVFFVLQSCEFRCPRVVLRSFVKMSRISTLQLPFQPQSRNTESSTSSGSSDDYHPGTRLSTESPNDQQQETWASLVHPIWRNTE